MKRYALLCVVLLGLALASSGCESFARKFVRKPKKEEKQVSVVVQTQEYESQYSVEELYKRYYLFWRAAQDELIDAMEAPDSGYKKQVGSAERVLENLLLMRSYLLPEKQKALDVYIAKQQNTVEKLRQHRPDLTGKMQMKGTFESMRRQIEHEFFYNDVGEHLISR